MDRPQTLGDRLAASRHRTFIGRDAELDVFRAALRGDRGISVIHVHGPGGTGKSALLEEFQRLVRDGGGRCLVVDAREVEASPAGFLAALSAAAGVEGRTPATEALQRNPPAAVLLDTFEHLTPIEGWLQSAFVPQLPAETVLVIGSRTSPSPGWRSDPGLSECSRLLPLRNLSPEESRAYLAARDVPRAHHDAFLEVTHGHPLTLALLVDILGEQDVPAVMELAKYPDVVRALTGRFIDAVPDAQHRAALEVCIEARVTTEGLLAGVLAVDDARSLFDWLRGLSFMEESREGIFPHDIARDAFQADFRWRDPDQYREMHRQVRRYLVSRFTDAAGPAQQRIAYDKLFMHKRSPLMRPYFDWASLNSSYIEPARRDDHAAILDMLHRHEGVQSVEIAEHWIERQPEAFQVWRVGDGPVQGFMTHLLLGVPHPDDLEVDPAVGAIWAHIQRAGPLRPEERFLVHRFWMGTETYQDIRAQSVIAAAGSLLWLSLPRLAWSFPCTADAAQWAPMFAYCNFTREPGADFEVGGHRFGVFAHDWRREPPFAWLDTLAEREFDASLQSDLPPPPPPLLVLSRAEFTEAVRQALRDLTRPEALAANPLTRSRLTTAPDGEPAAVLQQLVREALEALRATPREEKLHDALHLTYVQPAPTQEAAAERLGLPFSTYRYRLARGIERVSDWLWARELSASDPLPHL